MLSSPETPGISPETPGFEHSGRNSGYRPGNSGFGSPDTPGRCPDTPENVVPDTPDFWSRIRTVANVRLGLLALFLQAKCLLRIFSCA